MEMVCFKLLQILWILFNLLYPKYRKAVMVVNNTVIINLLLFPPPLVSNDGNVTDHTSSQNISYDVSKLVDFPGFNVPAPRGMKDVSQVNLPVYNIVLYYTFILFQ